MNKNLEKKIKDQIEYLNAMKMSVNCIIFNPKIYSDMKELFDSTYIVKSEDLGYFSCAIKYLDDKTEKTSFIT